MCSAEAANKTVLILTGTFILVVFMDIQAARHLESVGGADYRTRKENTVKAAASPVAEFDPAAVFRPVKESIDSAIEEYRAYSNGDDASGKAAKQQTDAKVPDHIQNYIFKTDRYYLYFIKFSANRSEIVRVERRSESGGLSLRQLLASLQEGPSVRERGLLNAMDSKIRIHGAALKNGILEINVSGNFERNGARIVQDRLDQLLLTLSQFPEVKGVSLYVDGMQVRSLAQNQVRTERVMGPPARKVESFH